VFSIYNESTSINNNNKTQDYIVKFPASYACRKKSTGILIVCGNAGPPKEEKYVVD
jgi:hypothetical protein